MTQLSRRKAITTALAALTLPVTVPARAQAWPAKPIRIIVTFPPGGLTDLFARAYGDFISEKLGQAVVVENKAGAGGILGAQTVKAAAPDGHTVMFTISATLIMNRALYKSLPYDTDKDFALISSMNSGGLYFTVQKSLGVKTLTEFFELAKTKRLIYGTYSAGSESHAAIAELNRHFGTNVDIVHYKGAGPSWIDFNAGVIHAASGTFPIVRTQLESGKGTALALWNSQRSRTAPDVPTFKELGLKASLWDLKGFICLVGPVGMPQAAIDKLSALMVEGGKSERVQKLLETNGIDEPAIGREAFQKLYDFEKPIWLQQVTALGLDPL